jgi:hypothetical protein
LRHAEKIVLFAVAFLANVPLVAQFSVRSGQPEKATGDLTRDDLITARRVTATLETDKGTVVIISIYGPKVEAEADKRLRTP